MDWYTELKKEWESHKDLPYEEQIWMIAELMIRNHLPVEILSFDEKIKSDVLQTMVEMLLGKSHKELK